MNEAAALILALIILAGAIGAAVVCLVAAVAFCGNAFHAAANRRKDVPSFGGPFHNGLNIIWNADWLNPRGVQYRARAIHWLKIAGLAYIAAVVFGLVLNHEWISTKKTGDPGLEVRHPAKD